MKKIHQQPLYQSACRALCVLVAIVVAMTVQVQAQRLQVVDSEGEPVAFVCATTQAGVLIGTTDINGWLSDTKGNRTVYLSHTAFEPLAVDMSTVVNDRVVLKDVTYDLPDVEVKPKELAYVQTYYRLIYFDDEGPLYFRGGVIDNTYEFATKKTSSKTRSLSKGENGLLRFLISTIAGRYIDKLGQVSENSRHKQLLAMEKEGKITITGDSATRQIVADSISTLGYIDTDANAGVRTTSFNIWAYYDHEKKAKEEAKEARDLAKGKKIKKKDNKQAEDKEREETFYEVYRIDEDGRSRVDDFVMRQFQVGSKKRSGDGRFMIFMQAYATDRNYVDKKEYKQLRKENKVDMSIEELRRFEQSHKIPPLPENIQAQIDKLFEKELSKKK